MRQRWRQGKKQKDRNMDRVIETEADQTLKRKQSDTEQRSCSTDSDVN